MTAASILASMHALMLGTLVLAGVVVVALLLVGGWKVHAAQSDWDEAVAYGHLFRGLDLAIGWAVELVVVLLLPVPAAAPAFGLVLAGTAVAAFQ